MKRGMNRPMIAPPVPSPLRQQVTDNLRAAIANCEFEPGGRLTERELCETLNVSRSTIRESLRQLESEGLVRIIPNKGPMIADLSATEARDIYEIREQLESYAFALCAGRANPQMIAAARAHLTAIKSAERGGRFCRPANRKDSLLQCAVRSHRKSASRRPAQAIEGAQHADPRKRPPQNAAHVIKPARRRGDFRSNP